MIETPETFFEQFQNFIEESGLHLKKLKSNLSNYFTKSEAIDTFLGKTDKAESAKKADEAIKAAQDASGNVITATYATKTEVSEKLDTSSAFTKAQADNLYLGKSAKAVSAGTADKATADASGNTITTTYATKDELNSGLAGKQAAGSYLTTTDASATYLTKTDASSTYLGKNANAASATKATQDSNGNNIVNTYGTKTEVNKRILSTGDRGSLAGYETSGTSTTINASSPDSNEVGSAITVSNGSSGTSWTKIVRVTGAVTVTLGSSWVWQGGYAPTIAAGGVLVCCWCGSGGIATFISPS